LKRAAKPQSNPPKNSIMSFFRMLGPGIITGAADDDPSGIATYSQTGAQFGSGPLCTRFRCCWPYRKHARASGSSQAKGSQA
jgi:hypothetical protein